MAVLASPTSGTKLYGAPTSIWLAVSTSDGTVTPVRSSYWKARRNPATNVGTYAA